MGKTVEEIIKETDNFIAAIQSGDIEIFYKYANLLLPNEIIIDFGTGQAKTAIAFGLSNPQIIVYTFEIGLMKNHRIPDDEHVLVVNRRLRGHGVDNVIFVLGDSLEVYPDWKKEIGILNIDSAHSYEQTKQEILRWAPFVKRGGYLLFHDYILTDKVPGVKQAVDELMGNPNEYKYLEQKGLTSVWQKL